tara:strand:+ start:1730 stop:2794 length:1065 start_codon:yes stop_codon:yes gene_type:complete
MANLSAASAAEVVLPSDDLDADVRFFVDTLGLRLELIFPADDPSVAVVSGRGLRLRLDLAHDGTPVTLRLEAKEASADLVAPNGTRIVFAAPPALKIPLLQPSLVITPATEEAVWGSGRAGMLYRDLLPLREGGRFIASHIRIPTGGPVPDYVHFHQIRFQMIYCHKGWVRVVYEDQGEPFVMHAGDCVLQPPEIRHQVLESSEGLEVVEIGCPAEHLTRVDHELELPTRQLRPERDFGGQRFVRHVAAEATWQPWIWPHYGARDLGIGQATRGLAQVRVARCDDVNAAGTQHHKASGEFYFLFVLHGAAELVVQERRARIAEGAALAIPSGTRFALTPTADTLELLEVSLPGG